MIYYYGVDMAYDREYGLVCTVPSCRKIYCIRSSARDTGWCLRATQMAGRQTGTSLPVRTTVVESQSREKLNKYFWPDGSGGRWSGWSECGSDGGRSANADRMEDGSEERTRTGARIGSEERMRTDLSNLVAYRYIIQCIVNDLDQSRRAPKTSAFVRMYGH
jgi:hypothetical protein